MDDVIIAYRDKRMTFYEIRDRFGLKFAEIREIVKSVWPNCKVCGRPASQSARGYRSTCTRKACQNKHSGEAHSPQSYETVLAEIESEMIDAGAWPVRLFEDASEHELTAEAIVTAHPEWRRYIGYIKQIAQRLEERQS